MALPCIAPSRTGPPVDVAAQMVEQHFTVQELAERWNFSADFVMDQFRDEPGVLRVPRINRERREVGRPKRTYRSIRIPASVAERVYRRLIT